MGYCSTADKMNTGAEKREKAESFSFENYKKGPYKTDKKADKTARPPPQLCCGGGRASPRKRGQRGKNPTVAPASGVFAFYRFSFFNASIRLSFFILFIEYSMLIKTTANTLPTAITIGTAGM